MKSRRYLSAIAVASICIVASCGGSSAPARETQGKGQMDCLRSAHLAPGQNSDLAFDVNDKFFRYGATDPAGSATKVDVYVFDDHDKALHNRTAITLQNKDNS